MASGTLKPGTQVLTDYGPKTIRDIREGDALITKAGNPPQMGDCSDEIVKEACGEGTILFGFNDEEPFFTANHVFYTTTGLRAIDPIGTKRENPWLEVGKLQAGHNLLRASDGRNYETVQIASFLPARAESEFVHGIHLRSSLRSYHANGYLVHLNYPEITVKSIARVLKEVPNTQRQDMLSHIKELQPVLQRLGAQNFMEGLVRELKQRSSRSERRR